VTRRARAPRTTGTPRRRRTRIGLSADDLAALRSAVQPRPRRPAPPRWNADPEEVQRSVARLVLTLAEFVRQLLERQAIRRMESGTLDPEQTEAVGLALMRLEETLADLASRFDLRPEDLNLQIGPLGRLL
jgi:hypothetical protein